MPVSDFRVKVGFLDHPKTRRLRRRCGPEGVLGLVGIWSFCASSRFEGVLGGLEDADVEELAGWHGEAGALIGALLDPGGAGGYGFLERREDGVLVVHDWSSHNGFIASFPERSAVARMNANARWAATNASRRRAKRVGRSAIEQEPGPGEAKPLTAEPALISAPELRVVASPRADRIARGFTPVASSATGEVASVLAEAVRDLRSKEPVDPLKRR